MKKMKRLLPVLLSVLFLFCQGLALVPVMAEETGSGNDLSGPDFSSCRILVKTDDEGIFTEQGPVLSSYEGVYLLQFDSPEQAREAYSYYMDKAEAVEVDTGVFIAEGEADEGSNEPEKMSREENPFTEAERTTPLVQGSFDVALIDTGADVQTAVSVIGENAQDDNGHGQQMAECIYEQNPDAAILSIKALGANGRGNVSDLYAAIKLAMSSDVRIINLSLSALKSADSEIIEQVIREACEAGITVVGAAGNNARNAQGFLPGGVEEALIIGAANEDGSRCDVSNYGPTVDYNVTAKATSNAAAKMSGWLSLRDISQIPSVLNQGLIFETDYKEQQEQVSGTEGSFAVLLSEQKGIRFSFVNQNNNEAEPYVTEDGQQMFFHPGEAVNVKAEVEDGYLLSSTQVVAGDKYRDGRIVEIEETMNEDGSYLYSFTMPEADTMVGSLLFQKEDISAEAAAYGFGPGSLTSKSFDQIKANLKAHSGFSYLGLPYVSPCSGLVNWGAMTASGFDCSGYVNAMVHWFYDDGSLSYPYTGEAFASAWWKPALQDAGLFVCGGTSSADIRSQVAAGQIRPGDIIVFGDYVHVAIVYEVSGDDAMLIHAYSSNVQCNWLASEVWAWDGAGIRSANEEFQTSGSGYYYRYDVYRGTGNDGYLKLHKDSADTAIIGGNGCYDLAGAVYTVYQGSAVKGTLTTAANGDSNLLKLPVGTYTVKETTPAKNYELDSRSYTVTITSSHTSSTPYLLKVSDQPAFDRMSIRIFKESGKNYAMGFPLEGAEFVVKYFDNPDGDVSGSPKRTWKMRTVKDEASGRCIAALDDPASFVADESDELYQVDGKVILPIGTISVEEVKPAPGYTVTGASLIAEDGSLIELEDGQYIGVIRRTGDGAHLSYGNLYTMNNTPIEVHTLAVNQADSSHYAKAGEPVTIVDTVTMSGTDCERLVNNKGEWDYIKYRLKGEVHDLNTGELLASASKDFITDDFDGHVETLKYQIADTSKLEGHTIYVSEYLYSYVTINDGKGKKHDEETLAACEDETLFPDLPDELKETQRIHFPKLSTTLLNDATQTHEANAETQLSLTDTIAYEGLIAGTEYEIRGKLISKKTGKAAVDQEGKEITSSVRFTAEKTDGIAELTFVFQNPALAGDTLVAFEELFDADVKIAAHEDLEDAEQSVYLTPVSEGSEAPKTGDGESPLIWLLGSGGALGGIIFLCLFMLKKKHTSKGHENRQIS